MRKVRIASLASLLALSIAILATFNGHDQARASTGLVSGWNNIAYLGPTASPDQALASLGNGYSAVYRWNAVEKQYEVFSPDAPGFANSITELRTGDSIWIHLTSASAELNVGALTGNVAVAASTFQPASDLAMYEKGFNELRPVSDDEYSQRYFAPVTLPDGVTITSLTAHFAGSGIRVRLDYTPLSNGNDPSQVFILAEANSTNGSSPQTASAYAHTVDNTQNVYFLVVDLTNGEDSRLRGVSIAYGN